MKQKFYSIIFAVVTALCMTLPVSAQVTFADGICTLDKAVFTRYNTQTLTVVPMTTEFFHTESYPGRWNLNSYNCYVYPYVSTYQGDYYTRQGDGVSVCRIYLYPQLAMNSIIENSDYRLSADGYSFDFQSKRLYNNTGSYVMYAEHTFHDMLYKYNHGIDSNVMNDTKDNYSKADIFTDSVSLTYKPQYGYLIGGSQWGWGWGVAAGEEAPAKTYTARTLYNTEVTIHA